MPNLPGIAAASGVKLPNLGPLLRGPWNASVIAGKETVVHGGILECHHVDQMPTNGTALPNALPNTPGGLNTATIDAAVTAIRTFNNAHPASMKQYVRCRLEWGGKVGAANFGAQWLLKLAGGPINFTTSGGSPKAGQCPVWWDTVSVIPAYVDWITKLGRYIDPIPEILMVAPGLGGMYTAECFVRWSPTVLAAWPGNPLTSAKDLFAFNAAMDAHAAGHPNTWTILDVNKYQAVDGPPPNMTTTQAVMDHLVAAAPGRCAFTNASMMPAGFPPDDAGVYTIMQGYGPLGNKTAVLSCQTMQNPVCPPPNTTGTGFTRGAMYDRIAGNGTSTHGIGMSSCELPDAADALAMLQTFDTALKANAPATQAATVPTAPGTVTATATSGTTVAVSWQAPASNGGASIDDYTVQWRLHPAGAWTTFVRAASPALSVTVTGLTAGTQYDFQVRAHNSVGYGVYTATPGTATTWAAPNAPASIGSQVGSSQIVITYMPPTGTTTPAISDYTVQWRTTAGPGAWNTFAHTPSTALTQTITGLVNGTSYDFHVAAVNSVGTGTYTSNVTNTPIAGNTAPTRPTTVAATQASSTTATVTWVQPAYTGQGTNPVTTTVVTPYTLVGGVWTAGATQATGSAATSLTFTGMTVAGSYQFSVHSINAIGTSVESLNSATLGLTAAPSQIVNVVPTPGDTEVTLVWDMPNSNNSTITNFTITTTGPSPPGPVVINGSPPPASGIVAGLTDGSTYGHTVTATNGVGTSTPSVSVPGLPVAPPPPPPPTVIPGIPAPAGRIVQPANIFRDVAAIQKRLAAQESAAPVSTSHTDTSGQVRYVAGSLDILGGTYVGQFGLVILDADGTVVFSQVS